MPVPPFPLAEELGLEIEVPHPGVARGSVRADTRHLNPHGVVHGGVLFTLIDTAMGAATMSVIPDGCVCASVEVHVRFLRPLVPGAIRSETTVVHRGRRLVHLESRVFGGDDRMAATATGTFAVLERKRS